MQPRPYLRQIEQRRDTVSSFDEYPFSVPSIRNLTLLTSKFCGKGIYLLDEPEAALSPSRQLAALSAIHHLVADVIYAALKRGRSLNITGIFGFERRVARCAPR